MDSGSLLLELCTSNSISLRALQGLPALGSSEVFSGNTHFLAIRTLSRCNLVCTKYLEPIKKWVYICHHFHVVPSPTLIWNALLFTANQEPCPPCFIDNGNAVQNSACHWSKGETQKPPFYFQRGLRHRNPERLRISMVCLQPCQGM